MRLCTCFFKNDLGVLIGTCAVNRANRVSLGVLYYLGSYLKRLAAQDAQMSCAFYCSHMHFFKAGFLVMQLIPKIDTLIHY